MSHLTLVSRPGTGTKGKRHYATEDDDLQAPMDNGWRRETTIREYTKSGIRGEVVYVAPCGKKFKQYPDIIRVSLLFRCATSFISFFAVP